MEKRMQQLEIKFFWPLTEQIPLDLDYTGCDKPKIFTTLPIINSTGSYTLTASNGGTITSTFNIDLDKTPMIVSGNVPWYRKALFKLLGFKIK
jgi:hypothetical protein